MFPRQYGPRPERKIPQMTHMAVIVLSETPNNLKHVETAIQDALEAHPLLRAHVEGDGEPERRIDAMKMVRKGDPNPMTFVTDDTVKVDQVLKVVEVVGDDRGALDASWKQAFARDMDDESWCDRENGPLWKLELHRLVKPGGGNDVSLPCALLFSFNHAISDQSSVNRLVDQMLRTISELEAGESYTPAQLQPIPIAVEDSVMGLNKRWSDVQFKGVSMKTWKYAISKVLEGLKNPVLLPDGYHKEGPNLKSLIDIMMLRAAKEDRAHQRRSGLEFRSIPCDTTTALLKRCRYNGVSMSNALTACMTMTASDFVGRYGSDQQKKTKKKRNYKLLQSLDMRRFGEQLDKGETMACMAGSMDLMHGPILDGSGEDLRKNRSKEKFDLFWHLAKENKEQTYHFLCKQDGPYQAVRLFDLGMTISDLNNLVYVAAQSKDTEGRAYSAGVTNAGVYEKLDAFRRKDEHNRPLIQVQHGRFKVQDIYFAGSHAYIGCLYQVSCLSVDGALKMAFHPPFPILSDETNKEFADDFIALLETVAFDS